MLTEGIVERLLDGTWITVQLVIYAGALGTVCAVVSGLAGASPFRAIRWANRVYVEFFRGSSAIIQLFWVFFSLPIIDRGLTVTPMQAGVIVLGLNMGGYGSEVVRGAIRAVPRDQFEAAVALSVSPFARMRYIIFPQALVAMLPPYGNLLIEMMKGTALVSLITLADVTWVGYQLRANGDLSSPTVFSILLGIYFVIALCLTAMVRTAERVASRRMGLTS